MEQLIILVDSANKYYTESGEGISFVITEREDLVTILKIAKNNKLDVIIDNNVKKEVD